MSHAASLYRDFVSAEQIDAEYKPSLRVADAEALMRGYGERSAAARTRLAGRYDIPYGPTRDEKLDVFPADRPNAPVFVFIHGGYWRAFSAGEHSFVALGPVALGITTVVVDYSLCPKVTIDEITRQCRAAVAWTLRHIGAHGGDPARVAVGGHSAGAHLSAMCLETRWDEEYGLARDPLAAALLVSGIYDIAPLRHSYLQPTIQLDDGIVRRNSPLFGVRPCATPVCLTWGGEESDEFARQSMSFDAAWRAAGNRCGLLVQPGAHHFSAIDGFADPGHPLCRWLADRLLTSP
jgi:arylformamidase